MTPRGIRRAFITLVLVPGMAVSGVNIKRHDITSQAWTTRYDTHFRKYAKRYFGPDIDWRWFKSQGIAESGLRNDVVSKAGAVGVMQILPSTFDEIHKKSPYLSSGTLQDPRWNIAAGIFYDRILYKRWLRSLVETGHEDGLYLAFASYNAGYGKITRILHKARQQKDIDGWDDIEGFAPSQTRHYVRRIKFLMGKKS
jgi:membrane-bound lytic murein transglycosylase F